MLLSSCKEALIKGQKNLRQLKVSFGFCKCVRNCLNVPASTCKLISLPWHDRYERVGLISSLPLVFVRAPVYVVLEFLGKIKRLIAELSRAKREQRSTMGKKM